MAWLYFWGGWMFGFAWNATLSSLRDYDGRWKSRIRRVCFVLGVAVMLGATAVIVAASNGAPGSGSPNPSRVSIWIYCLGCAIPVTLFAYRFARTALVHRRLGAAGTLLAVLVLAASGEAFRQNGRPLNGLGATAHDHHALVMAALLVPLVVIGLACLPLRRARAAGGFSAHPAP